MPGVRLNFGDTSDRPTWLRNILELRRLRGWTQAQLAHTLNVHRNTVWNWENRLTEPDPVRVMPRINALLAESPTTPNL